MPKTVRSMSPSSVIGYADVHRLETSGEALADSMPFQDPDTARQTLRQATESAHDRLHVNAAFSALFRGDLTRLAYQRLLIRLLGLHQPIEDRLGRLPGHTLLEWRGAGTAVSRTVLLRSDLAALGLCRQEIDATPQALSLLPPLDGPASALGCAWVVEGSALGGRLMSGKVNSMLGLQRAEGGGAFFASDPNQPARWRGCCEAVEACGAQQDGLAAMTRSAVTTFAAFETWLDPNTSGR